MLEATPGRLVQAVAAARALGGDVETSYGSLIQVSLPASALGALEASSGVADVRPPLRVYPAVTGQGVALTNADDWQAAGLTGAGVKVGVLDLGFTGYEDKLGTEFRQR